MAKRRRKTLPPADELVGGKARVKREDLDQLHDGKFPEGFPPPNHLLPIDCLQPNQVVVASMKKLQWPLTQARLPSELATADDKLQQPVFIDVSELKGEGGYYGNEPPTWMDPHLLVSMALKRPEVVALLEEAFQKNKLAKYRLKLQELLQTVFEEDYMPYLFQHFWGYASEITAQWMLMTHCDQALSRPPAKRRTTKGDSHGTADGKAGKT